MNKLTFGLTGSIACGKSTVSKYLQAEGIPLVDADLVAREVVVVGSPGLQQVVDAFGPEYLAEDGSMDRKKLGAHVSANKESLALINRIMYPLIKSEATRQIQSYHDQGHDLVGYDAALIIESGNKDKFRPLIVVWAEAETQIERLIKRNSIDRETALVWISLQLSSDEKAKHADYILRTNGTHEELRIQTLDVLDQIRK